MTGNSFSFIPVSVVLLSCVLFFQCSDCGWCEGKSDTGNVITDNRLSLAISCFYMHSSLSTFEVTVK